MSMHDMLEKWTDLAINKFGIYHYLQKGEIVEPIYEIDDIIFILTDQMGKGYYWEKRKSTPMLSKLANDYKHSVEIGKGGHVVGFCVERDEVILLRYEFPKGNFTLRTISEEIDFCHFDYDVNQ